ncbi:hypothetical protein BpHYR1_041895 [Brachionus plicatilis]|uniref:Uncharacterized protein n=1 Tax=Brachionus plicatilis TaxID=10195 RepID=A0A3M7S1E5_BRAPC|nr:hypothetical protein BpHYR1_041895 [Brachionus plicatilis]
MDMKQSKSGQKKRKNLKLFYQNTYMPRFFWKDTGMPKAYNKFDIFIQFKIWNWIILNDLNH